MPRLDDSEREGHQSIGHLADGEVIRDPLTELRREGVRTRREDELNREGSRLSVHYVIVQYTE